MSKGSSPRPFSVTQDEYSKRWDMIFGRDLVEDNKNEKNSLDQSTENIDNNQKINQDSE